MDDPEEGFGWSDLPDEMRSKGKYRSYEKQFKDYLYRNCYLTLYKSPLVKGYAPGGATEPEAKLYFAQKQREERDLATEKLRDKYAAKMKSLEKKIHTAKDRVERETAQYEQARRSSWIMPIRPRRCAPRSRPCART